MPLSYSFRMEQQCQTLWCFAAAAVSIDNSMPQPAAPAVPAQQTGSPVPRQEAAPAAAPQQTAPMAPPPPWTQCLLYNTVNHPQPRGTDCCPFACNTVLAGSECNRPGSMLAALVVVGRDGLATNFPAGAPAFSDFTTEIGADKPIGVRLVWNPNAPLGNRRAHIVVVSDAYVQNGVEMVRVEDPSDGSSSIHSFTELLANYSFHIGSKLSAIYRVKKKP